LCSWLVNLPGSHLLMEPLVMVNGYNCSFVFFFSVAENNAAMASALFNALGALTGGDMWEAAENCPEMFDKGGYYYEKVVSALGPLQPNQHCTLPVLPNKVSDGLVT